MRTRNLIDFSAMLALTAALLWRVVEWLAS